MPNDLKTQRNLLNLRPESRPESRSESPRQKLASSGFTASIWTLSGVVLVACSNVEDFLGIDDGGGGGGGGTLHVHSSPVQGARIYFDVDGGGVSDDEMAAQDAEHPQGFISNAEGRVLGVPNKFYGLPFEAHLDGAFDTDTGESLSGILHSIPNPNEENNLHTLASPITEYFSDTDLTVEQLMTDIEDILPAGATDAEIDALLRQILDPTSYDGSSRIDALARYLDETNTPAMADIMAFFPATAPTGAASLEVDADDTFPAAVTIGAHDSHIATIDVVNYADGAVEYYFVDEDGARTSVNGFAVSNGVISVADGATLPEGTTTMLRVMVSNDEVSEMVSVAVTVADSASTPELGEVDPGGLVTAPIVENVEGATTTGTDLVTGITATGATNPDWVIRAPGGLSDKFDVVADGSNWKLVLKAGESLDYEAFSNGVFDVEVRAVEGGVRSNALTLTVMVTDANDAPVFLPAPEDNDQNLVGDGGTVELSESARAGAEVARVRAADADASGPNSAVTYEISGGTGMALFAINNSGVITVLDASMIDYESGTTSYTLEITASDGGTPALTDTMMLTVDLTDANDNAPMVTADAGTIRTTTGNNDDTPTGYSITVTDADTVGTLMVTSNDRRFTFERDDPNSDTWNLVLLAGEAVTAGTITLGYTATDGVNPTSDTITLMAVDTPVMFTAPATRTIPLDENNAAGAAVATVTATSSDTGGAMVHIQSFALVDANGDAVTDGIFDITTSGLSTASASASITITDANALDYETAQSHPIYVLATDTAGEDNTLRLTVNVNNVHETGTRSYEVMQSTTDLEDGTVLTAQRVANSDEDPDGVAPGSIRYQWSADGTEITGATSATYTISGTPAGLYTVEVSYLDGYNAALPTADQMRTEVEASTSSVSWDVVPSYDPVANPLTDGEAPMANDPVIPMTAISASGGDGKIEYSIEDPSGVFQIHPNSGALSVSENGPAVWDFETTPSYEIYIIATDVDDGSTMGTGDTARQRVVITVQDANDAPVVNDALQVNTASGAIGFGSQENLLVRGDDITAMLGSGITPITGATAGDDSALDGTAADEYIYGDAGDDTITGGGGTDHIIGGAGDDGITLASGSVETIYYRFSTAGFAPIASDGADTVTGFRRGEDRIVLLDTDSTTPFDRDTLLSDAQNAVIGSSTFSANPLFDVAITEATVKLTGFQIVFDDTFFTINYATDSEVTVRSGGNWLAAAVPYLGALDNMGVPEDFASGAGLRDNSLLLNYFMPSADVLISEKRNAEDGFFATVSATDPDAAPNNEIMRYDISGGTGSALFTVDVMGRISVSDGVNVGEGGRTTLDYDTTSEYTLEITATDAGGAVSDPTTITIGLIENGEAEYSISKTGDVLTATRGTADPEGLEAGSVAMYRWYTTTDGGTNKNYLGAASTANTLDTSISGNEAPTNAVHGVEITYTDGVGIDESIDVRQSTISFTSSDSREYTRAVIDGLITDGDDAGARILTANIIGTGTASYSITGGADRALFSIVNTELTLNTSNTGFPTTQSSFVVEITATDSVTGDADVQTFTVTITASSPAIIPDRQAFAHQDPYEPNDDQNDQTNQDNPQTPPDIM